MSDVVPALPRARRWRAEGHAGRRGGRAMTAGQGTEVSEAPSLFTGVKRSTTTLLQRSSPRQTRPTRLFERFDEKNFPECFKEYADLLTWDAYWHTTLDTSNPPFWK